MNLNWPSHDWLLWGFDLQNWPALTAEPVPYWKQLTTACVCVHIHPSGSALQQFPSQLDSKGVKNLKNHMGECSIHSSWSQTDREREWVRTGSKNSKAGKCNSSPGYLILIGQLWHSVVKYCCIMTTKLYNWLPLQGNDFLTFLLSHAPWSVSSYITK